MAQLPSFEMQLALHPALMGQGVKQARSLPSEACMAPVASSILRVWQCRGRWNVPASAERAALSQAEQWDPGPPSPACVWTSYPAGKQDVVLFIKKKKFVLFSSSVKWV